MMRKRIGLILVLATISAVACDDGARDILGDGDADSDGTPTSTLVGDIERGGNYVLELTDGTDTLLFECTPQSGALITKLSLNGTNILAETAAMNGSTFWVAPQTAWGWPPPAFLDTAAFTPAVDTAAGSITLTSEADANLGIQVAKKFSPDLVNFAIVLEYSIVNTGGVPVSFAPWEISRVLPGGVTFFPTGSEVNTVDMNQLTVTDINGISWLDHTVSIDAGDHKYCADGSRGWLAHAAGDLVFVKSFNDEAAALKPPGQGEIQLYVKGGQYEEVEQMGPYGEIPAGGQTTWTVRWYLRRLPPGGAVSPGNQALVDFVDNLVS
jgi:hypothetical protein